MRRFLAFLTFLALLSLLGSAFYYLSVITFGTLLLASLGAILITGALVKRFPLPALEVAERGIPTALSFSLFAVGVAALSALVILTLTHPVTSATRSLWLLFSPAHILLCGIAFTCTILIARFSSRLAAVLGALVAGTGSALAALLFPLGFGFDPFLHRATLAHIAEFGTITPKPFYYIGAYILELFGSLVAHLPLFWVDILLAPVGLAVLVYGALRTRVFHPALLALIPLAAFISTTPQAVGFLWALAVVLALRLNIPRVYTVLFALAACAAHPIAGVPALALTALSFAAKMRYARVTLPVLTFFGALGLPLLFFAQQFFLHANVGFSLASLADASRIPSLGFFSLHGNALLDTVMLVGGNLFLLTSALALTGFFAARTRSNLAFLLASVVAFGNFLVLSLGFDFPFLISYERTDFALRMITLAWLFLLPLASEGISFLGTHVFSSRAARAYGTLLAVLTLCANIYVAYPRHDGYTRSAAFNVTAADQEIVHTIADNAGGTPYVVLSNQTLASMAIQELGFFQYYHGDIFAYPVPTSGPLYAIFLSMIEEGPTLTKVQEARDLTGASTVYFVVHNYWWEADDRIAEAKKITDDWFTSADGTVTVFVFTPEAY